MKWHLIQSGFNTGRYNMEFDVRLARNCGPDEAFFRLYRWEPYCISLGANQSEKDINTELAEKENIGLAKRPTGGRAILHAEEITYSVVIPTSCGLSAKEIYSKISIALVKGLSLYDPALTSAELENIQPDFAQLLKQPSGMLCFASTARNEVKYNGKKLIGSAQRKLNNVILQHGSILCGDFHRKLPVYLNSDEENKKELEAELAEKTIEIETITGVKVDYKVLAEALIAGFENEWQINFGMDKKESGKYEHI